MAMDEAIMLDVLKALTRVELKIDMMMQDEEDDDRMEGEPMDSDDAMAMGAGGGSQQLSFEMPPFILD